MLKRRGKGKISNDLVAASCAAVLAVYAAGYSRTRDAARRFETQAKLRRAATSAERPPVGPKTVFIEAPASLPTIPVARKAAAKTVAPRKPVATTSQPPGDAPITVANAVTAPAARPAPGAPVEIAPVPLPAAETSTPAPIAITRDPTPVSAAKWRDGIYTGLGDSPHGDIEARVVIKDGRIVEAGIASCDTRYPCSVIDPLIHQPVERQSPNVDYMSHATESSDAYYYALVAALDNALERSASEPVPK